MCALDFLGVSFARAMHVGVQMPGVGIPIIGRKAGEPTGRLQPCFALHKDRIFVAPKRHTPRPRPYDDQGYATARVGPFIADKTPPLSALPRVTTCSL